MAPLWGKRGCYEFLLRRVCIARHATPVRCVICQGRGYVDAWVTHRELERDRFPGIVLGRRLLSYRFRGDEPLRSIDALRLR